jgi:hypothetical protein
VGPDAARGSRRRLTRQMRQTHRTRGICDELNHCAEIDAAVVPVLFGVESHWPPPFVIVGSYPELTKGSAPGGGLYEYQAVERELF